MGLSWRDLVSTLAMGLLMIVFGAYEAGARFPLVATAWAASGTALSLAIVCAVTAAFDLHTRPQPLVGVIIRKVTSFSGAIALIAGLAGLIVDSSYALEVLVVATLILWGTATCWHVYGIGADS